MNENSHQSDNILDKMLREIKLKGLLFCLAINALETGNCNYFTSPAQRVSCLLHGPSGLCLKIQERQEGCRLEVEHPGKLWPSVFKL